MTQKANPPAAVIAYGPGEDDQNGWHLYLPRWDVHEYPQWGITVYGWVPDCDREPVGGPFATADDALAALARMVTP